jgi:hypothetical protein
MAVPATLLEIICRAAGEQRGGHACSAGYPDMLVTREQLQLLLGAEKAAAIPMRPDSANIIQWHVADGWLKEVPDASAIFQTLGYSLDVLDISRARGDEIVVDLNYPLPAGFDRKYDLVLDTGTCEHCFHIGQAALNLAQLVRQDGLIIQAVPLNSFNHGFYNVNPTWVFDFYPLNGFEILYCRGISNIVTRPHFFDVPLHDRFDSVPENSVLVLVARRTHLTEFKLPTQHKYVVAPKLGNE